MGKFVESFKNKILAFDKSYERDLHKTYLTGPEWRNVEMAEEYADYLRHNKPFYRFPFFRQIGIFWKVFSQSYRAARQKESHMQLIFSEYMLMSLFVGISTTLEGSDSNRLLA